MSVNELSFRIGGEAGQGLESSGANFAKALTRAGLHVLGMPDYYSRIRGGHNYYTVRASERPVWAIPESIELLLALNAETISRHVAKLTSGGAIIVDESTKFDEGLLAGKEVRLLRVPMAALAEREGNPLMANTAALAVAAGVVGLDLAYMLGVIEDSFQRKGDDVVQANRRVAQAAYDLAQQGLGVTFPWKLTARPAPPRVAITGNEAFALGALMGGCRFVAGYPMTPATTVLVYMAQHAARWGLVVKHAESEIAAVNMCVGAGVAGVRAMAPTSGGGFDLMTEGLSLAGVTETPLVIYLAQRPGPATGLPTRTAQGDLFLALHASHGEYPRIVLAPHTVEEAFQCAVRALNLAEKYQCLVIVLSDHHNASSVWSADASHFDCSAIQLDRGKLVSPDELGRLSEYQRYAVTPDGVSPRALPGSGPKAVYLTTGDEHDADGYITEEPEEVEAQMSKRLRKLDTALAEMRPPLTFGPERAEITFVTWGSSYGAVRAAMDALSARGTTANMRQMVDLWPLPVAPVRQALAGARRLVDVEGNATAQLATLLRAYANVKVDQTILRYDGRSFTPEYILERLEVK